MRADGEWVEVGECGLALPAILDEAGLPSARGSGLAMGVGLDRLLMLAKGIDDIRLLPLPRTRASPRSCWISRPTRRCRASPRCAATSPWPSRPRARRRSWAIRVRQALGERVESLESVEVRSETDYDAMPAIARQRIGMEPGQKNVRVRIVIRDLARTLTSAEANRLRDAVYASLHEGRAWRWAEAPPDSVLEEARG